MGVADIGLRNVDGSMTGYVLNTPRAEGSITITQAQSVYVDGDGPDMYGVQLNSVLTNVTLFGNSSYEFWAQDFVSYTSSSGELAFGDNIWNFSDLEGEISPNVFYAHSTNGTLDAPIFYYAIGPTFTIHYPFTVTFYLNATTLADRPALFFNYTLSNATMRTSGSFDYVIFNSSASPPSSPATPAEFQVNGTSYDPVGLINDIELSILGNDNGDTTTFYQLSANATLDYWNSSADPARFEPVPSAVNAGADTGETSDGVASYYTSAAPTVARLGLGPSFLDGLWNTTTMAGLTSTGPGVRTIVSTVTPAEVMIMVNPGRVDHPSEAQWVPASASGTTTFYLPNYGYFFLNYLLSEYAPANTTIGPGFQNTSVGVSGGLTLDTSDGIYTPIILWNNAELATFAVTGSGTLGSPYVLYHNEGGPMTSEFAQWNDFQFPVFPGLLLINTTDYVHVTPPPFTIDYPSWMISQVQAFGLPSSNNLQVEFWNVSHVVLENAMIQGWLSAFLLSFYPLGDVIFWNSSDNLVAGNTFNDQGSALALYGGTDNTVWGNTFLTGATSAVDPANVYNGPANQSGLWESESGDLIYNNLFSVPIPAYTPTFDPLSCQINCTGASYVDTWNVSDESASVTSTVLGVTLTGSIIGTVYQGGNFWSNYGTPSNPYGLLPYADGPSGTLPPGSGLISNGGDYVPLVPFSLYEVTFTETGLPGGTVWGVTSTLTNASSIGPTLTIESPNGTFSFSVEQAAGAGFYAVAPASYSVDGASIEVKVTFLPSPSVTFSWYGQVLSATNWTWQVTLVGNGTHGIPAPAVSNAPSIVFANLTPGGYEYFVSSEGYYANPANGTIDLNGSNRSLSIELQPVPYAEFDETGLPAGTNWSVEITVPGSFWGIVVTSDGTSLYAYVVDFPGTVLTNSSATANYTVSADNYTATPSTGSFIPGPGAVVRIAFTAQPGEIALSVAPVCAEITLDGVLNQTPTCGSSVLVVPPGVHSLVVSASGYLPYSTNVSVAAGQTVKLTVALVRVPVTTTSSAGIGTEGWELIAVLAALAAVLLVISLILYSRRRRPARPLPPAVAPSGSEGTPEPGIAPPTRAVSPGPVAPAAEWDESAPPNSPGSGEP